MAPIQDHLRCNLGAESVSLLKANENSYLTGFGELLRFFLPQSFAQRANTCTSLHFRSQDLPPSEVTKVSPPSATTDAAMALFARMRKRSRVVGGGTLSHCSPSVVFRITPLRPTSQQTLSEGAAPAKRSTSTPLASTFQVRPESRERSIRPPEPMRQETLLLPGARTITVRRADCGDKTWPESKRPNAASAPLGCCGSLGSGGVGARSFTSSGGELGEGVAGYTETVAVGGRSPGVGAALRGRMRSRLRAGARAKARGSGGGAGRRDKVGCGNGFSEVTCTVAVGNGTGLGSSGGATAACDGLDAPLCSERSSGEGSGAAPASLGRPSGGEAVAPETGGMSIASSTTGLGVELAGPGNLPTGRKRIVIVRPSPARSTVPASAAVRALVHVGSLRNSFSGLAPEISIRTRAPISCWQPAQVEK